MLNNDQKRVVSLAAHQLKNIHLSYNDKNHALERVVYVTVLGQSAEDNDHDWKVEMCADDSSKFTVTDLDSNESTQIDLSSFDFEHNSLIKMQGGANLGEQTFQLMATENDIKFDFYF